MGMSDTATSDLYRAEPPGKAPEQNYLLHIGGDRDEGLPGIPLLPPYYAYLIKISEGVSLVDIYPFLAEIIFHSRAIRSDEIQANQNKGPANIISIFIDDQRDNIANAMLPATTKRYTVPPLVNEAPGSTSEPPEDPFLTRCLHDQSDPKLRPRNFIIDTFGRFGSPDLNEDLKYSILDDTGEPVYLRTSLVGAGNPMRMMQRFSKIMRLKGLPIESNASTEQKYLEMGKINCFLINSISYLYRTMGFRDAMLLVRQILEKGVWKPSEPEDSKERIIGKNGLLFSILHDGVFKSDEIRYAETFFDAIINFETFFHRGKRLITYQFDRFPLVNMPKNVEKALVWPKFGVKYAYLPVGGKRMSAIRLPSNAEGEKVRFKELDDLIQTSEIFQEES
jgi:hypothetical protein